MINVFTVRRYAALLVSPLASVILFYIALVYYGTLIGVLFMLVGLLLGTILGNLLLRNPFSQMLEGKGILAINLDSTGVLRPFIVGVRPPYIEGKYNKQPVQDVFNRETVFNLAAPIKNKKKAELKAKGGITIDLDETDYNKGRFGFFHYPVILWNDQLKTIITKDFFSETEKSSFAEHGVLYLNRKMQELTSAVRDFGRYVVELTKPAEKWWQKKWVIWVVIIILIIMILLFAPAIITTISKTSGPLMESIGGATSQAITPK